MFKNPRYATKVIEDTIPVEIQMFIWKLIDSMEVVEKDYLQIFELRNVDKEEKIVEVKHIQEEPEYVRKHIIKSRLDEETIIFVIDDGEHSTMMLAEEY